MKSNLKILLLQVSILPMLLSCGSHCNDCLELTTKSIKYVDANGANLLFGNQAIYHPDSVDIRAENNRAIDIFKQEATGTIMFDLDAENSVYRIFLSDTLIATLEFALAARKSKSCCGNVVFSTQTLLNGQIIDNNDLIVIVR